MVGTLIVAAAAGTTAAGVAASFALTAAAFAVNFAVSMIVTRMFGDNPESQQDMGVRQQVPPSSVNAIPVVYGDAYMGGTFVDAVLTTDQKTMYYVLAISSISSANSTLGTSAGVFNYNMSEMYYGDRLISFSSSGTVQSARVFNGGTGYAVGNVLTISNGSFTTAATVTVASVTIGGVIATVTVSNAGSYTAAPNNPAITTGGTGTGASIVLKFSTYTSTVTALCDEAGNVDTKINTNLYINLYKSSSSGVIASVNGASLPSVVMGGSDISAAQQWTGTRQMNNLAFAIVKLVYNRDADTTQLNPITFNVSHYPNGASVAKPGDVWLDYITNQEYGGAVGWLPDGSFSASFVDTTCVAPLNAYSDQTISYTPAGGGAAVTQARYRINGVLDAGQSVLSNLDRIMSACDSWMTYNAALGQWSVVINKAETTAYAFNDDNIIGEIRVSATDITSSINQVEARFPFKSNRDQAAFVNLETPYGLLYPNEPVNKYSITYDLVNDSVQAQYLANRLLEQAREDLIVSFSTTYYGIQVDAGTVVSVTNADYGWTNKLFRVMKVNEASLPDGSLGAKLELNEYNAQVYDDYSIQQFTPAPNSGLPSVSYFSPLAAPTVTGFPSATIPYINVQVFIPTTGRVTFGSLFWTTSATPTSTDWKLVTTATTTNNQPVTNGTYYTFANITLNTGTYYFAYNVGNDITTSILSPISAALVWNPVAGAGPTGATGPTGTTGGSGDSVDIIFKRSATQPATPSPSVGTPATWYSDVNSVPAGSDPIWSSVGTNTGTGTNYTWQTPLLIEGQNGTDGLSVAELLIYIRATSTPATPTGGSYNFTTQTLTAPTSWFSYVPSGTDPVYTSRSVASIQGTTGTDSTLTWSTPTLSFQNGATGPTGITGPTGASVTGPNGLVGLSSLTAYKVQAQNVATPTFTTPTTGATAPSGWSLTAPSVAVGQVLWYIMGRYNANAVTVDGVGAGQTAWTGPVAASIFQDIRSDNWNGSTPPTYGSTGTYGTVGYYISQSTGNCYFNNGIFRGDITGASGSFSGSLNAATGTFAGSLTAASGTFNGDLITTGKLSLTGSGNVIAGYSVSQYINSSASYACIYANNTANAPVATFYTGNARTIYAQNTSSFSGNSAIVGDNVGNGAGIQATGNTGTALIAFASSGNAFACQGAMTISSSTLVTNLNANYLQGNLASAFVTSTAGDAYAANRLNGSAGTNVLRFVQGTLTGAATATFSGTNKPGANSANVWIQITIDGTTLYIPAWT
jgi:hypothetical protein